MPGVERKPGARDARRLVVALEVAAGTELALGGQRAELCIAEPVVEELEQVAVHNQAFQDQASLPNHPVRL